MRKRIDRLMSHLRSNENIVRHYGYSRPEDLTESVILYGVDMLVTISNLIAMEFHNISFFVPNFGKMCHTFEVIANPETLDYKVKLLKYYSEDSVLKRDELDEQARIYLDGMVAKTLWNHRYGQFPNLYPIMSKDLQVMLFGEILDDEF